MNSQVKSQNQSQIRRQNLLGVVIESSKSSNLMHQWSCLRQDLIHTPTNPQTEEGADLNIEGQDRVF